MYKTWSNKAGANTTEVFYTVAIPELVLWQQLSEYFLSGAARNFRTVPS